MIFCSIGQYYPRAIVYKSYGSIGSFQNCYGSPRCFEIQSFDQILSDR